MRRTLSVAVVTAAALTALAGPASADTLYATNVLTYTCTFPATGAQPMDTAARFTGPDAVASGGSASLSDFWGGFGVSQQLYTLLTVYLGYDGVRGSGTVPVTATNATTGTTVGVTVPEQFWGPVHRTFDFYGTGPATVTAGYPGAATFSLATPFSLAIELHRKQNNTWLPWTLNCAVKVTSPAQNRTFSPSLTVT
ncbi:hypothetical protein M8542_18525 [Amycolatopsis sp. OK19-0408]|uniref:DUF6801 domain-containing protein n=1 Tax=Amycolatopsis iheyensis TaxID=2945988 RepID=A0A9X2NBZ7_9PSEU|nr:DUF6801 domain-containing protein [Amycolatopsis iheyensis]MCR6484828.1 hypothetical protein [Amycolatopsis iheyensis]